MTRILFGWGVLLVLLALQATAALSHAGWLGGALAAPMIAAVAVLFMDLLRAPSLSRIFALAGLFWLVILIGLTSVDFLARYDEPAPVLTRE